MSEKFSLGSYTGTVDRALSGAAQNDYAGRIWAKDVTLWKGDPSHRKIIENALGWLTVAADMKKIVPELRAFADSVRQKRFTAAFLLGMGGSSLCPGVCAEIFGTRPGYLQLVVLDTTDPAAILSAENSADLVHTLFIVSSKSGGTIESASLHKYFYEKLRSLKGENAGDNFVAITDPGTSLEKLAHDQRFLRIFLNPKDIGGRYSALSYFGLVPMALIGMDIATILDRALGMAELCRETKNPAANPGVLLGTVLGGLAAEGRDKVTFAISPEISAFGYWIEQLIAESTGKEGTGILPVEAEVLGSPARYGTDRVFVSMNLAPTADSFTETELRALETDGHPVLRYKLQDRLEIGGEFFRWEFATAVAGAVLKIDPFDQPNVQESKDNTARLIQQYIDTGRLPEDAPQLPEGPLSLYCESALAGTVLAGSTAQSSIWDVLSIFFKLARAHDYVAIMAYLQRSATSTASLNLIRGLLGDNLKAATTVGFGPRFLHSTGQLHKGGPNKGVFLQITCEDRQDLPIPGERYSLGTLKQAQALGDLQSLIAHGRRVLRIHIKGEVGAGLERLSRIISDIFTTQEV